MRTLLLTLALLLTPLAALASPLGGPQELVTVVPAYTTDTYVVTLYGNEDTVIEIVGDCSPGQDIDLWIYDENGYLIDKVTDYGCDARVVITPAWTGPFSIHVENDNHPYNTSYYLGVY